MKKLIKHPKSKSGLRNKKIFQEEPIIPSLPLCSICEIPTLP